MTQKNKSESVEKMIGLEAHKKYMAAYEGIVNYVDLISLDLQVIAGWPTPYDYCLDLESLLRLTELLHNRLHEVISVVSEKTPSFKKDDGFTYDKVKKAVECFSNPNEIANETITQMKPVVDGARQVRITRLLAERENWRTRITVKRNEISELMAELMKILDFKTVCAIELRTNDLAYAGSQEGEVHGKLLGMGYIETDAVPETK